ncbi:LOW QUALITY PROTEIN: putative fasciclin-like arabinogalactan protein 20, partial [Vigna umbellata]|uniref:LOW QUALITY PROTEIN: putative fasciclin-like arabinogalactan protein 20 n=1 Tax=Vigna umbellata TaxID=87088 RepID=UPI001F5ECD94
KIKLTLPSFPFLAHNSLGKEQWLLPPPPSSLSLLLLILLPFSSTASTTSTTLLDAVEFLSSSGFQCMALHLELASQTLQPHHSLIIFAPTDAAFEHHHLHQQRHPRPLPRLPSPQPHHLPHHQLLRPTLPPHTPTPPSKTKPSHLCAPSPHNHLSRAARLLRSHRFSLVASLLDLQLPFACNRCKLTLFAPLDKALSHAAHNLTHLSALLRHHLVPCKIVWRELAELRDGTLIGTYEKGFSLNVTVSKTHTLLLNGVQVVFPDMFRGDCLVVHGVQHVFSRHNVKQHHHAKHDTYWVTDAQDYDEHEVSSHSPEFDDDNRHGEGNSAGHYHFSVFH